MATSTAFLLATAAAAGSTMSTAGFSFRRVTLGATSGCWPTATTLQEQQQGLMGVRHPARPMVFIFHPAASYGFWMEDTPAPLTGVWIGTAETVIGLWRGIPETTVAHTPPAPVTAVVEYPAGWQIPPNGSFLRVGRRCSSRGQL